MLLNIGSLEAINFQIDRKFPEAIVKLVNEVFEFVDNYNADFSIDPNDGAITGKDAQLKHAAIQKYLLQTFQPGFKTVLKKFTKIDLFKLVVSTPVSNPGITAIFCDLTNVDVVTTKMIAAAAGIGDDKLANIMDTVLKNQHLSSSLDKMSGVINNSVADWKVTIGIPLGIFCFSDFLPTKVAKTIQLTSDEITAAILHEIGHVFGFVEYLGQLCYTNHLGNSIMKDVDNIIKKDPEKAIYTLKKLSKQSAKISSKFSSVSKVVAKMSEADAKVYTSSIVGATLIKLLLNGFVLATFVPVVIIATISHDEISWPTPSRSTGKNSSQFFDKSKNLTMYERYADEYVSRHMFSKYLNTALMKIYKLMDYLAKTGIQPGRFNLVQRQSMAARAGNVFINLPTFAMIKWLNILTSNFSPYESDVKRLNRNIQNMRDGLSETDVSQEMKFQLLKEIKQMEKDIKYIDWMPLYAVNRFSQFILMLLPKLVSGNIRTVFTSGDVSRTYNKYNEGIEKLLSNKSGQIATEIHSMLRG